MYRDLILLYFCRLTVYIQVAIKAYGPLYYFLQSLYICLDRRMREKFASQKVFVYDTTFAQTLLVRGKL